MNDDPRLKMVLETFQIEQLVRIVQMAEDIKRMTKGQADLVIRFKGGVPRWVGLGGIWFDMPNGKDEA
jgi:hypothetical protein